MKTQSNRPRKLLTTEQVAELREGTTANAIRILAWRRQIPHIKVGKRLYFYEDEIFAWLDSQRRVTTDEAIAAVSQ